ncbi:MAG: fimbrillin family protein [Flavobacteriales bacterium]|nr:fimbrillin family protein [Flavobacteriales bacterium]
MNIKHIIIACAAVSVVACSKNEGNTNFPEDSQIRVSTAAVNTLTKAGTTSENITSICYYITPKSGNATYTYEGVNARFENNQWVNYNDQYFNNVITPLWEGSDKEFKICAYSPYYGTLDYGSGPFVPPVIELDQSTEANLKNSDFVYSVNNGTGAEYLTPAQALVNKKLPIVLNHMMSKMFINISLGTEMNTTETSPVTKVQISGVYTDKKIALFSDEVSIYLNVGRTINMHALSYTPGQGGIEGTRAKTTYECIVGPAEHQANDLVISIYTTTKVYKYTIPTAHTFVSGQAYALNLNVGVDGVTGGDMTIANWEMVSPDDVFETE